MLELGANHSFDAFRGASQHVSTNQHIFGMSSTDNSDLLELSSVKKCYATTGFSISCEQIMRFDSG